MEKAEMFGVNEQKLNELVLEITDCATRLNAKFNLIESLINDTKMYFNCETADTFRSNFETLKENFPIVNKNIVNMSNDLVKVKLKLTTLDEQNIINFNKAKQDILSNSLDKYERKN